jgi:hypothetical protein
MTRDRDKAKLTLLSGEVYLGEWQNDRDILVEKGKMTLFNGEAHENGGMPKDMK